MSASTFTVEPACASASDCQSMADSMTRRTALRCIGVGVYRRQLEPAPVTHFQHARNRGNFGLYFTWRDRWCGTEDPEYLRHGDTRFGKGKTN